jgi:membrane fusion protein (multidrug efflux system)
VQLGQRINAGTPLLTVVPLNKVWVDANFREVQLGRVRIGQPVRLHADVYGKEVEFHGNVAGLSAGSGSAFALLPAQNASGNWIKIVQRVPVRIAIDPKDLEQHPLRIGLSMTATIDVAETSGPPITAQMQSTTPPARPSLRDDPQVARRIADIIGQNAQLGDAQSGGAGASDAYLPVRHPQQQNAGSFAKDHNTEIAAAHSP